MINYKYILFFVLSCCWSVSLFSQKPESDTLLIDTANTKVHSPLKATLMSTFVPGLGQVYNKKYWKVPIVYVGLGTSLYFAYSNHNEFKRFKEAYLIRIDSDLSTTDEFDGILSDENIKQNMEVYRRNRDYSILIAGLVYIFNIVDAAVDAHLFTFPVNDNLSFTVQPMLNYSSNNQLNHGFCMIINL